MNPLCKCHGVPMKALIMHEADCRNPECCRCSDIEPYCEIRVVELRNASDERRWVERVAHAETFAVRLKEKLDKIGATQREIDRELRLPIGSVTHALNPDGLGLSMHSRRIAEHLGIELPV